MLPHHSAPVGPTQVSVIRVRVTWLEFHSQRENVMKKICFSTQLYWQNVTANATFQLAVIAYGLKPVWPLFLTWRLWNPEELWQMQSRL